jgi:hypothetical protein
MHDLNFFNTCQNLHTGCLADTLRGVGPWCGHGLDGVPARGGSGIVPRRGPKGGPPTSGGPPSPIPGTPSSTRRRNWSGVRGELPVLLDIDRGGVPPGVLSRMLGASGVLCLRSGVEGVWSRGGITDNSRNGLNGSAPSCNVAALIQFSLERPGGGEPVDSGRSRNRCAK